MGTSQSNEGAAKFFNNLGSAITNDIAAPGNIANALSNTLNSGIASLLLPIAVIAGIYIISQKL